MFILFNNIRPLESLRGRGNPVARKPLSITFAIFLMSSLTISCAHEPIGQAREGKKNDLTTVCTDVDETLIKRWIKGRPWKINNDYSGGQDHTDAGGTIQFLPSGVHPTELARIKLNKSDINAPPKFEDLDIGGQNFRPMSVAGQCVIVFSTSSNEHDYVFIFMDLKDRPFSNVTYFEYEDNGTGVVDSARENTRFLHGRGGGSADQN